LFILVCQAIQHAHQKGIIHRDIKPSNILVTAEGQAKLVDMGLARFERAEKADDDLTSSGVTLGTFDYMAPEQARDSRQADIRSDIYSLGCTFYFILTGKPPFPDGSALQKLLKHQSGELPNLAQLRPDVPESVAHVFETMLAKRPEDRFQNPAELLAALIAVTEQLGIVYPQISLPAGWSTRPQQFTWFHRHAAWLVPAVLLLLSVLTLGIVWHRQQPAPAFSELRTGTPSSHLDADTSPAVGPAPRANSP
jgi:serine/threonine-protein kinase